MTIFGDLEVSLAFGNSSYSGTATGFADSKGDSYSGTLNITNGDIRRFLTFAEPTLLGDIDGTLRNTRSNENNTLYAEFRGDIFGNNQASIGGVVRGDLNTANGNLRISDTNAGGTPQGEGFFRAEKR